MFHNLCTPPYLIWVVDDVTLTVFSGEPLCRVRRPVPTRLIPAMLQFVLGQRDPSHRRE